MRSPNGRVKSDQIKNTVSGSKILPMNELAALSERLRKQGKRVVLSHGVFDLIHNGHIRHLQRARERGDVLFVTVTADPFVNKGPDRPVFNQDLRAEVLAALACVDYVSINDAPTAISVIKMLKPHLYAKGNDYKMASDDVTGNIVCERNEVESHGGSMIYTDEITFSSSSLLNEHFNVVPEETKDYLRNFKRNYSHTRIIEKIRSLTRLNVLILGDAIIDEYHYTSPLGQTGKGNILAVKYESREQFAGGAMAAANHVAGFSNHVTLATGLGGARESHEEFVRSKLRRNIDPVFFCIEDAPTVVKRRYVDPDMAKLFEVYFFKDEPISSKLDSEVCAWLNRAIEDFDVVIVPDFGNGFMTSAMVKICCDKARFLVVNTQVNSGNRGYHVIDRYPRVDFVVLNEPEVRLASRNRHDSLEKVALGVARKVSASHIAVTRGTKGVMMIDVQQDAIYHVPALSTKVVDRVGAGDSFLSLAGLCLGGGMEPELALFVGSVAAALDVQIICNREPVNPIVLFKYIATLLK